MVDKKIHWKKELELLGKDAYELKEMIKLGFFDIPEGISLDKINELFEELTALKKDKEQIGQDMENLSIMLKKIHTLRVLRVQKERELKKQEQALLKEEKKKKEKIRKKTTPTYLGEGVSKGLVYGNGDSKKINKLKLPVINDALKLAKKIKITSGELMWLSYHAGVSTVNHYHDFSIPKRSGGIRKISSPKPLLRTAQKWILDNILNKIKVEKSAMGFIKRKSIIDNANLHKNNEIVIRMDLKDFFPSIDFKRVKGMFHSFGYSEAISTIFALITTKATTKEINFNKKKYFVSLENRRLPQGACTSPYISNIIARGLDLRISKLAKKAKWNYTRYADDIVISSKSKNVDVGKMIKLIKFIIFEEDFILNDKKTSVMYKHHRQVVTGIVVNNGLKVSRRDLRNFRAFLHQYNNNGKIEMSKRIGRDANAYLLGYLSFVKQVNKSQSDQLIIKYPWIEKIK